MKTKKILSYVGLPLLGIGATLTVGLLSFGGIYVIIPLLPLAAAMFFLSISYEGEIYLQNIKGGLHKLFQHHYLQRQLAKNYLLEHCPDPDTTNELCPQFFRDYVQQLRALEQLKKNNNLSKADKKKKKKKIKKTLNDMEKWFASQLFAAPEENDVTEYEQELRDWLVKHKQAEYQALFAKRRTMFRIALAFSIVAGIFMGISTSYLLVGEIALIPFIALLPATFIPGLIIPLALIAGIAYGILIYHTITEMIKNETLQNWYRKFKQDFAKGITPRNVIMAALVVFLVCLTIALTVCTAGTWWTIARTARPLFSWMVKIPSFVMGVVNPIITGVAALIFNLENTSETLEMFYAAMQKGGKLFSDKWQALGNGLLALWQREHWLQLINPFRLLLKLTLTPLRILFFFGHLISIGVMSDRVPGIPAILSALFGIITEGFEDAHYFLELEDEPSNNDDPTLHELLDKRFRHEHGHSHNNDIPTRLLKFLFTPVYLLATGWAYFTSRLSTKKLTFAEAWHQQTGHEKQDTEKLFTFLLAPLFKQKKSMPAEEDITVTTEETPPAAPLNNWNRECAIYKIERYKEKHFSPLLVGRETGNRKKNLLTQLQSTLKNNPEEGPTASELVAEEATKPAYAKARLFKQETTATTEFLLKLSAKIQ